MAIARTLILILACISFVIVIGGGTYEHAGIVPVWASAVPASLAMYQGEYAIAPGRFWIPVHPMTLVLFIIVLIANWRTERCKFILVPLAGYAAVLVMTFVWFVPELMAITQSAYSATVDAELTRRAGNWKTFSLMRLAFLLVMAMVLLFGLSKSGEVKTAA